MFFSEGGRGAGRLGCKRSYIQAEPTYRVIANEWTPFHTGFELFLIVLGKSDENMPYWLGLGDSFAMLYMAVTYLVQDLY